MKDKAARVLVGTLFSGENELEECLDSVRQQKLVDIEHIVIRNLPNQLAHQTLYRQFNQRRKDFDYFAKLDADMRFVRPDSLARILRQQEAGVDILSITVHDGITNTDMQSFNVFSKNCIFYPEENDSLFTDRLKITYPGRQLSKLDLNRDVQHAFNPSPYQAFMFGVHRALKVMQYAAHPIRIENSYHQKRILFYAYKNYVETQSVSAHYALLGASWVIEGKINDSTLFQKADYLVEFEKAIEANSMLCERLKSPSHFSLFRTLGAARYFGGLFYYARRKGLKFPK